MTTTLVILASGRLADDLLGDVGPTDVGWLPFGGRPLLHAILGPRDPSVRVVLTVPPGRTASCEVFLQRFADTVVIECEPSQGLAEVAATALEAARGRTTLVFGDTVGPTPCHADEIQVCEVVDGPRWTTVRRHDGGRLEFLPRGADRPWADAVTGVFAVSEPAVLAAVLREGRDDAEPFYAALREYEARAGRTFELQRVDGWLDFGHLDTFHESRRRTLDSRAFNSVRFVPDHVAIRKSSHDAAKLRAEREWLREIGRDHAAIVPRVVGPATEDGSYEVEYLPLPTVAEALVCCSFDMGFWQRLLRTLGAATDLLHADRRPAATDAAATTATRAMLVDKTRERLARLDPATVEAIGGVATVDGVAVPTLEEAVDRAAAVLEPVVAGAAARRSRIHGDLFFGNLLYDRRADRVVMIDPRGSFAGTADDPVSVGDPVYDLAKLSHSMLGRYDHVLADVVTVERRGSGVHLHHQRTPATRTPGLDAAFVDWLRARAERMELTLREVRHAEAMCFLSLLPLHAERPDRQLAFAATALHIVATDGQVVA